MEGQGKAVEGQGKAVDGQGKAAHCTDGVSEKRGTVLEQGESLPFSLDVLLSHLLLREPVPLVLRPVGEAGGLSDTVVVDPVVVDVRLNGAKGGGALAKGAVFCFIALAKGAFFVLNYKNKKKGAKKACPFLDVLLAHLVGEGRPGAEDERVLGHRLHRLGQVDRLRGPKPQTWDSSQRVAAGGAVPNWESRATP